MKPPTNSYTGYRYPAEVVSHAVWLYHRFTLSFHDVDELLPERSILVGYETVRQRCLKYGSQYAFELRRRQPWPGDE